MTIDPTAAPVTPVSLDARYLAAWAEMNTRITQRQNLITIYVTLALAGVGAAATRVSQWPDTWRIAYLVPAATAMFVSLLLMHERMLHNLQVFLADCERVGLREDVPTYHRYSDFTKYAARARIVHDYVCGGLILGFNVLAGVIVAQAKAQPVNAYDATIQVLLILVVLASLIVLKRISDMRHKPDGGLHEEVSGPARK